MLFPTVDYAVFLALVVFVHWLLPRRARLVWLGTASICFYASWKVAYLPLLLGVVFLTWAAGMRVARQRAEGEGAQRKTLALTAAVVLTPLLIFKYLPWIGTNIEVLAGLLGHPMVLPVHHLPLPIGISFFTFQVLATVIDVKRGGEEERNPWRFMTFIALFPHLVAGPIVRAHELLPSLRALPDLRKDMIGRGLYRIGIGMLKKIVFADLLSVGMVDPLFAEPSHFSSPELMLGLYAYTLQIYCDFSAYTDIALGSALLLGFELPENFRRPYKAASVAAFWRRWHMTLSSWVRDYVYFPMGGARVDRPWKIYRNLMMTLLILGIWHGASWNFVIYGLLHGTAVCVNRWQRKRVGANADADPTSGWPWLWRMLLTLHFVVLARILFRAEDLSSAWAYTTALLTQGWGIPRFSYTALTVFVLGFAVHFSPEGWEVRVKEGFVRAGPVGWALGLAAVGVACAVLGTGESLSFIYYSF